MDVVGQLRERHLGGLEIFFLKVARWLRDVRKHFTVEFAVGRNCAALESSFPSVFECPFVLLWIPDNVGSKNAPSELEAVWLKLQHRQVGKAIVCGVEIFVIKNARTFIGLGSTKHPFAVGTKESTWWLAFDFTAQRLLLAVGA